MKRILVDKVFDGTMVTTEMVAAHRVPQTPQIDSDNIGRTMLRTVSDRMYRPMDARLKVQRSGSLSRVTFEGPRFTLLPGNRAAQDLDDAFDSDPVWCGKESQLHVQRAWVLDMSVWPVGGTGSDYVGMRMKCLEHQADLDDDYGLVGLAIAFEETATGSPNTWVLNLWKMYAYDENAPAPGESYKWVPCNGVGKSAQLSVVGSLLAVVPSADICELPDGTLVMAIMVNGVIQVWKSYDGAATWAEETSITYEDQGGTTSLAMESLGWNIVLVCATTEAYDGGSTNVIGVFSSIDTGYTWDEGPEVYNAADKVVIGYAQVDMARTYDGRLVLAWMDKTDTLFCRSTRDGFNWTTDVEQDALNDNDGNPIPPGKLHAFTILQNHNGTFGLYYCSGETTAVMYAYSADDSEVPYFNNATTADEVLPNGLADYGMLPMGEWAICARNFARGAFTEVMVALNDYPSTSSTLVMLRTAMWDGVMFANSARLRPHGIEYTAIWGPWIYPSDVVDPDPHSAYWYQILTGAVSTLYSSYDGYLRIYGPNVSHVATYSNYNNAGWYSAGGGVAVRFAVNVTTGRAVMMMQASSVGNNKSVAFSVYINKGAPSTIQIVDNKAGGTILGTFTPSKWDVNEWNYYTLLYGYKSVALYRAPGEWVHDLAACELLLSVTGLTEDVYVADTDGIGWGVIYNANYPINETYWRLVAFAADASIPGAAWDPETENMGARISSNDVGIGAGVSVGFLGSPFVQDDAWDIGTDYISGSKNLFVPSPSIMWREPEQQPDVASPARTLVVRRDTDAWSEDMLTRLDGFAMFGRNFRLFKLEGVVPGSPDTYDSLFDTAADGSGDIAWVCEWQAASSGVNKNLLKVWPQTGSPATFAPMTPSMFASDGWRNYYVAFTSGAAAGDVVKILDNTDNVLSLESNVQEAGVVPGDHFVVFGSSFAQYTKGDEYAGYRLTIYSQKRTVSEDGLQLGTLIVGEVFELPDEEWGFSVGTVAAVTNVRARSGYEQITEMGRQQRIISVKFTGLIDDGIGRVPPVELYRSIRSGERPLVWYDDSSPVTNDSERGLCEPVLVRITKPPSVSHATYVTEDESDAEGLGLGVVRRNVVNVDEMVLSEVL